MLEAELITDEQLSALLNEPSTILTGLNPWVDGENWETICTSNSPLQKLIEFSTAGRFRVTAQGIKLYEGQWRHHAIDSYNSASSVNDGSPSILGPTANISSRGLDMPNHHTITVEELNAWLDVERWETFASSGNDRSNKKIEFSNAGRFRVTDHDKVTYEGDDQWKAVEAYNNAQ